MLYLKNMIYERISNVKTINEKLNNLIKEEKDNIISNVNSLIEKEIYPKVKSYSSLSVKTGFNTLNL